MRKVIHKADTRGLTRTDWLDSRHTFSFNEYFNAERINFGALRVLNDDRIGPGSGFQTHPHKNMEIVTIPLHGTVRHGDSKKNSRTITVGDIQVMSAGTGIFHSEVNDSQEEVAEFLQIWILPNERNKRPFYQDYSIREIEKENELTPIIAPDGSAAASLCQNTWFSIGKVKAGNTLDYSIHQKDGGIYIFVIDGEVKVADTVLSFRDGIGISETNSINMETLQDSQILLIEVPMRSNI